MWHSCKPLWHTKEKCLWLTTSSSLCPQTTNIHLVQALHNLCAPKPEPARIALPEKCNGPVQRFLDAMWNLLLPPALGLPWGVYQVHIHDDSAHMALYVTHYWGFFFDEKKDGGIRPSIDYKGLNFITIKYPYLLPRVPSWSSDPRLSLNRFYLPH